MSVNEIADLIDSSISFVQDFINKHLAGSGQLSFEETIELKEKDAAKAKSKKKLKAANEKMKTTNEKLAKNQIIVAGANKLNNTREMDKRVPTKVVDYSQLQTVRIDSKTTIYTQPGETPAEAKERYLKALERGKVAAPKKIDPTTETKICSRCETPKLYEEFSKDTRSDDGYRDMCKVCNTQTAKLYAVNRREARNLFI
jgi:predicted DNA-binding protein YlxM (UPF0122 family)